MKMTVKLYPWTLLILMLAFWPPSQASAQSTPPHIILQYNKESQRTTCFDTLRERVFSGLFTKDCNCINGKPNGVYRRWHSSSQLAEEVRYKAGKYEGMRKIWNTQGQILVDLYYEEGELFSLDTLVLGKQVEQKYVGKYRDDGFFLDPELVSSYHRNRLYSGYVKAYHEQGGLALIGEVRESRRHGAWTFYDENGQKYVKRNYKNGQLTGWQYEYWPNGQKKYCEYRSDSIYQYIYWYETSTVRAYYVFKSSIAKIQKEWYDNGQIGLEIVDSLGLYELRYPNGRLLRKQGENPEGSSHYTYWSKEGVILEEGLVGKRGDEPSKIYPLVISPDGGVRYDRLYKPRQAIEVASPIRGLSKTWGMGFIQHFNSHFFNNNDFNLKLYNRPSGKVIALFRSHKALGNTKAFCRIYYPTGIQKVHEEDRVASYIGSEGDELNLKFYAQQKGFVRVFVYSMPDQELWMNIEDLKAVNLQPILWKDHIVNSQPDAWVLVNDTRLNLREGPSQEYKIIATIPLKNHFRLTGKTEGNWAEAQVFEAEERGCYLSFDKPLYIGWLKIVDDSQFPNVMILFCPGC